MQNDIYHLRLTNGDEIVGQYIGESERLGIVIKSPMLMTDSFRENDTGMVLTRYTAFNQNEFIEFRTEHVISVSPVIDEMAEYYKLSIRYTDRIAQRVIKDELKDVNSTLRTLLFNIDRAEELFEAAKPAAGVQRLIYVPEANTLH